MIQALFSYSLVPRLWWGMTVSPKNTFLSGKHSVGLEIFFAGFLNYIRRQIRRRGIFIPAKALKIIPDKLLVKAGLSSAFGVRIYRPETRRVRSQDFINQNKPIFKKAKFKFGVGYNYTALNRVFRGFLV